MGFVYNIDKWQHAKGPPQIIASSSGFRCEFSSTKAIQQNSNLDSNTKKKIMQLKAEIDPIYLIFRCVEKYKKF
jgi:hypothetical protein